MFKPRSAATPTQPPSIEQVRQRAKHRLIGVAVLVLAAVVVLPLLFDSQPRPIPVDVAIEIPSRQVAKPLVVAPPVTDEAPASPVNAPKNTASAAAAVAGDSAAKEEVVLPSKSTVGPPPVAKASGSDAPAAAVAANKPAASAPPVKSAVPATKPTDAPPPRASGDRAAEAARAQALLEGKPSPSPSAPAAEGTPRFIVQVGAFADPALAQQTRQKLERAGLKTYTHVAQTADGKRIRVRLGPFVKRADAEKAAAKAKSLGTAAAILTL